MRRPPSPAAKSPRSKPTFVVIGGRATGVETVSELHERIHDVVAPDEPNIDSHRVRILLVDRNEQVFAGGSRWTSTCASRATATTLCRRTLRPPRRRAGPSPRTCLLA